MVEFADSYVMRVLLARPKPRRDTRPWRRLANSPLDAYQPGLHYMRGPGPEWRRKNLP